MTDRYIRYLKQKASAGDQSAIQQLNRAEIYIYIDEDITDNIIENRRLDILSNVDIGYRASSLNNSHHISLAGGRFGRN